MSKIGNISNNESKTKNTEYSNKVFIRTLLHSVALGFFLLIPLIGGQMDDSISDLALGLVMFGWAAGTILYIIAFIYAWQVIRATQIRLWDFIITFLGSVWIITYLWDNSNSNSVIMALIGIIFLMLAPFLYANSQKIKTYIINSNSESSFYESRMLFSIIYGLMLIFTGLLIHGYYGNSNFSELGLIFAIVLPILLIIESDIQKMKMELSTYVGYSFQTTIILLVLVIIGTTIHGRFFGNSELQSWGILYILGVSYYIAFFSICYFGIRYILWNIRIIASKSLLSWKIIILLATSLFILLILNSNYRFWY